MLAVGLLLLLTAWPLLSVVNAPVHGDVRLYEGVARSLLSGKVPYRDTVLEYPPYVIPLFVLPAAFGLENYPQSFALLVALADSALKTLLLLIAMRDKSKVRWILPLLVYAVSIPAIRYFYLQRYDVLPALITVLSVWLFSTKRYALAGLGVALGTGVKLYPILFAPPLLLLAWKSGQARKFMLGLLGGLLPMAALSFFLPWWNFLTFHGDRGLQVESLYASFLWLGKLVGLMDVKWAGARAWMEVQGPAASLILPWTRLLFALAVSLSTATACWLAIRLKPPSASGVARLLLVPLLAFVAFNQVLSPQYMIWLLPLAALACLEGDPWPPLALGFATFLTPFFYPSPEYGSGLGLSQTLILVVRNLILIAVWALLIFEGYRQAGRKEPSPAS